MMLTLKVFSSRWQPEARNIIVGSERMKECLMERAVWARVDGKVSLADYGYKYPDYNVYEFDEVKPQVLPVRGIVILEGLRDGRIYDHGGFYVYETYSTLHLANPLVDMSALMDEVWLQTRLARGLVLFMKLHKHCPDAEYIDSHKDDVTSEVFAYRLERVVLLVRKEYTLK